ncbi:MAG TPA: tetratricopeptide repeat protein [Burkholderiales bacterium]|nr:tetratricopeptide repeat protein [Burkholderiales bacterium]
MTVVDVDRSSFERVVIEGSRATPVVVDFWAPWCGPCRALGPILEKLAEEYGGRFVLAKINSDENPELSRRYGVRGIPNVKAFIDGEMVDEFSGALPEGQVRQFLDRLVPSPADELRDEAAAVYAQTRDADAALAVLARAEALQPDDEEVRIDRAAILADAGRADEARAALDALKPLTQMDDRVSALRAKLDLAKGAAGAAGEDELAQRIAANPGDLDARLQLAHALAGRRAYREALAQLLEIVQRDRRFRDDAGRKTMLKIFELIPDERELVSEFRRKLAQSLN